jgi:hypothetical protein
MPAKIGINAGAIAEATVGDVSCNPVATSKMNGAPHNTASGNPPSQARKDTLDPPNRRVGVKSTAPSPKRSATTSQIPRWWLRPNLVTTNHPESIATDKPAHANPSATTKLLDRSVADGGLFGDNIKVARLGRLMAF